MVSSSVKIGRCISLAVSGGRRAAKRRAGVLGLGQVMYKELVGYYYWRSRGKASTSLLNGLGRRATLYLAYFKNMLRRDGRERWNQLKAQPEPGVGK